MKEKFKNAVESEDEQELINCLDLRNSGKIDSERYAYIEKALTGTWHNQQEDLVNTIYLENLSDDRFVKPILNIALDRERFRWYDDELEATLRKCVHALKTINSESSNQALTQLEELNNENVKIALEMYKLRHITLGLALAACVPDRPLKAKGMLLACALSFP